MKNKNIMITILVLLALILIALGLLIGLNISNKIPSTDIKTSEVSNSELPTNAKSKLISLLNNHPKDYNVEIYSENSYKTAKITKYEIQVSNGNIIEFKSESEGWGADGFLCEMHFSKGQLVNNECFDKKTVRVNPNEWPAEFEQKLVLRETELLNQPSEPDTDVKEEALASLQSESRTVHEFTASKNRMCFYLTWDTMQEDKVNTPYIFCFKDGLLTNYYYSIYQFIRDYHIEGYPSEELINIVNNKLK